MNLRPETIIPLEENIGSMFFDTGLTNMFLDIPPQARKTKAKINKWGLYQTKSFWTVKETTHNTKDSLMNGRKYLQTIYSIMGYIQNIQRNHTTQKQPHWKVGRRVQQFSKEDI